MEVTRTRTQCKIRERRRKRIYYDVQYSAKGNVFFIEEPIWIARTNNHHNKYLLKNFLFPTFRHHRAQRSTIVKISRWYFFKFHLLLILLNNVNEKILRYDKKRNNFLGICISSFCYIRQCNQMSWDQTCIDSIRKLLYMVVSMWVYLYKVTKPNDTYQKIQDYTHFRLGSFFFSNYNY